MRGMLEEMSTGGAAGPPIGLGVDGVGDLVVAGMVLLQTNIAVGDQDRPGPVITLSDRHGRSSSPTFPGFPGGCWARMARSGVLGNGRRVASAGGGRNSLVTAPRHRNSSLCPHQGAPLLDVRRETASEASRKPSIPGGWMLELMPFSR